MEAKVTWKHDLSFNGHSQSGFDVPLGTSVESGGADDGMRPMELILVGLAGCTGMDVISILQKKQQKVSGFEIKVQGERTADHPRVFTEILVEYVVKGKDIDPAAVERSVQLSTEKYCSVQAMLTKAVHIQHKITIIPE